MDRIANESALIEALAEAERTEWFVRNGLANAAFERAGNDTSGGIQLLRRAIEKLALNERVVERAN